MSELLVDSEERRKKAEQVLKILKFIPKTETFISDDCDQESDLSSELPNPFSDDDDGDDDDEETSITKQDIENAKKVKVIQMSLLNS